MVERVKYPRTPHLPWPPGISGDDILLDSLQHLEKLNDVVVTEKLDGEYMFARHSIFYNRCKKLDLEPAPVLYRGQGDEAQIRACWRNVSSYGDEQEGYVVRNAGAFLFAEFKKPVAKYVRADHVTTTKHWKRAAVVANQLVK